MGSKEVVQLCALVALFCSVCSLNRAGTKFATVVTENYSDGYGPSMSNLVFTAQSLGTTIVTVFGPGPRFPLNLEINSIESKVISLPEMVEVAGTVKSSNTIVIESSKPITVVLLNSKPRTADATVVYPIKEWGVEYFALTPDYVKSSKQFAIINADQPNTVEVDLKGDVRFEGKQYRAGTKLTVSLSKFESFQLQSSDDLSGTRIKSEGPVGVITGHTCSAKNSNCNTLVQQLLPVPQWGTTFIVPPLPYQNNFDLVYVTASQQTNFQIQSGSERKSLALDRGQSTSLQISPQKPLYIHASAGIQVLYFCTGGRVGGQMFDPFLMNILPTDTFCQKYSVQGQEGFTNQAMVVSKTTDISGILFDKKYAVQSLVWTPIPGTEYSWALSDFGSQPIQHVVEHPTAAIGVYSIGKADQNAYGTAAPCYTHSDCPEITDGIQYATLITQNYLPGNDPQFNLSISARSAAATQVSINAHMPGFPMCLELEQSRSQVISLPQNLEVQGSVTSSNMIIITSQKPLSSILMNYKTRTADTTIVYPVTDWGNEYYVVTPNYGDLSKLFAVMNLENSNSVDVYLTGKVTFNQKTYIKGSKLTIFLSKYESVQLMSMDDLSGTKIVSTKPVGVIAGHVCSNLNGRCNVLFEQLLPVTRWGSSFIVPPQPYQTKEDYVYVAASQSTNVLIQYGDKKDSKQLNSREVIPLKIDGSTPLYITASQGIQVMFYSTGGSNDKWGFDTFLMNIVPTNLFCRKYFIQGYDKFENRLLVVAKPSDISEIRFDNQLLLKTVKWAPVKGTEYSWAHIEYGLEEKPHYIEHPKSSFGVYSIGTVLYNGYGSPAPCAIDSVPMDPCDNKQCRTGEKCQAVNGQATCVPVSKAECITWGDPHYRTFDGRSFDFQGTCTYTIAKTCGNETLPSFNIEAKNENRGSTRVAYLKHVNVQVYGLTITMAKSENGRVRINQNMYYLPSTLQDGKVKIYQSGGRAVLDTDFGLRLSYDWNHHLTVSVTSTFLGQLCGLCGNYNGNSKDDFVMVDGKEANNAASFGRSWKVKDDDPACWDDCKGECKTCESSLISKYQGEQFCGLLAKVDGPFRDCHAVIKPELFMDGCVYDVCLNDGFSVFLCQALKTYADACQAGGVEVYNWRKQSQCPLTCPPNSHYESCGSACPASCSNPSASVNCKLPCTETCQCNDGFVLSAGECVPVKKCGCTYQDRYYPPGVRLWSDNSCEQSCICDTSTGKVQCRNTKCKSFEDCKVVKGVRGCYSNRKATCRASGDPHYISFDGRKFDFQGTCFYQLAAVCNPTDELEKFQVQVQNEHRGNKAVAYTRLVQVNVYGHIIIVSTDHAGKVQVDNLWENLPLSLEDNRLSIQSKGWKAVIETGFGLQVTFDWKSQVEITVPESYAGTMCGLCGNYNHDGKDDLTMKNGQLTKVPAEFGASWKTEDIPGCSDQCKGTCPNCDVTQKRQYETNEYCGIITDLTGPFRDCHAKVPPTYFFDDCVFDTCLYKGIQSVVCKAISGYVTKCQEAGAQVYKWRTDKFCTPVCPQNSHYEVCASGCPSTCASLTTGTQCDALCEEGCQCNEGFILSGVQCVPIAQCGCMYSGRYYKAGEMFFPDGLCTSQCTCGASGAVRCQPITCGENEVCKVQNGVQGCHPLGEGKCTASGDPHYTSFDGLKFDFQGTCTYTLAKLLYTNGSLTPFEVQVENESYGNKKVAVTRMVVTKVNGYSITMEQKVQWKVKVNGINTNLPLKLDDGKFSVIQQGKNIILQTEFGLKVLYDSVYYVQVTVPGNYRNKVGGLCGNFNGNKKDEFALQGGGLTENVNAFGASWNIFVEGAKCNHGCDQDCPRCDETKKAKYSTADSCGIISSTTGPFAACRSVISPDIYFENCVFDVCATDGLRDILCRNLEAYTAACQDAGVIIKPWRNDGFCPMTCPKNSQYEVCADTCRSACAGIIAPLTCTSQCYEGCQCDPGFVFDGEQCVSSGNCGCSHNGRYMKVGESLMSADCSRKCTCNPKGAVSCETIQCTTGCAVQNGAQICLLVDLCKKKQCRNGETCQQVDNQAVCLPLSKAECIAWGDPHYRTFDRRSFDFQGTCTYTIAKTCGNETLPSFNIEAKNENRGSTRVAYLKHVNVQVYGLTITMAKSENGRVRVNQNMYYLPSTLQDGKVKIYQSGGRAVLETDFGLRLSYDWNHHLTVSVTSTFLGQLCGLCGNYNGDSKDDFVMVDGKEANNAASFGRSWKVKDDDPACWDDCKGECKTCESSLISKYQGEQFCGLLAKVDGPFRDCHAVIKPELFMDGCVYDVCLNDGFSVFLCQALKTYADACQAGGVEVYNWRKQSQCPLTCPPNSHYESCGSACPASCSNPSASVNCKLPCTETCQCNDGFVLSAGECVPVKKCGCTYQDRYYPPGVRLWSDNNCEQSCICDAGTGKVQCRNTKCKSFEVCKVVKGVRGCYSNRKATCRASGDPHYISFDGRKFDFQGTCFYQLAAVCNATDELEKFQVQVQNEHRGNKAVAYTRLVQVNVYGHIIIVSTDHAGKVQVDNLWENLPLSLEDNRLSIQSKGWKAVIETGFGLQVTFDWKSQVEITVPESYAGAMCGLCGNYNQDDKDDLTMKNGQLTKVPAEFGASWKTEDIPGCSDQCKGTCPNCDVTQKRQYETNEYCGIITDPTGPFRDCHAKVPPTYFFDDCVFDACLYKGIQSVVCKAISGYVTKCQEAGAQVYAWRTDTFCTPVCPENSHYEMCASGCPSTCASLTTGTQCDALCEEGCQCNEGFILSGVQCVPISQCGCMYSGRYYKAGEMFFPDGLCTSQCTCGASGAVQCQPITCGENEVCKVQNGVQGCHPLGEGKCTASGDPHYTSFDGLKFDFQGTCTYTLAKLLYTNGSLTPFEVQVENESYGNKKVAVTRMVVTKVNGYSITMEQKVQWRVKVNGINTNLPLKLDDGKVSVIQQGKNIILQTEFGLKVLYDSVYYVQVTVPGNYRNKVGGLCGNFNGNKKDEFALQGGGLTENVNAFGASWNIFVEGAKCNHGCDQDCPRCDETKKAKYSTADSCGIISSTTGPFAACHSVISPDIYFENCVFDVCATDGLRDILCRNLEAYTAACQDAGVIIKPWRNDGFCPMTCPKNSQYEVCADTCRSACAGIIAPLTCISQCYEGCQCDPGFVFDGEQCVSSGNCGCSHNGRYMKVGESLMSADCSRKCTCNPKGAVSCETIQCTTGCAVQNGAQICLLVDPCTSKQCRNGETCQKVDNQAVCLPLSKAECIAWGDPHYRTFDRRSFDFQGTCTYTIAKTCGNETLPSFNIEAKNENRGSTRVAYLKHVNVQVYGLTITMAKSENGRVRVNQNMYYLPSTLQDGKVKIYQSGGRTVLETDFGLRLSYDWNHHLTVSVTSTFLGQLCGLCGNYNGDSKDDFVMVDGKEANNAASFGRSWKVKDDDPACWDDCKGECKTCESSLISKYQGEQFCGLLAKVDGPFRDCHAVIKPELFMDGCVYDVCLNDGFSVFLCQALKTYADACQAGGVEVYNWRKQSQCPLTCPPNSHYVSCGSACPASCSNPSASVNCKLPCTETCQCNDGFVLSAGECVPVKKCGCTYQDRYYPPGVRLWSDNSCEQSCICDAGTGKVQCRNTKCKSFEVCKVVKGVRGCYSNRKATCRASGDPHYISFDGRKFDFQGTCFYQLAAVCNATDELEKFQVQVQNEHRGNKAVAYTRLVQVNVYGHIIIVSTDHAGKVQVDNLWENLPLSLEDNRLSIQSKGWKAVIETGFGLQVTFDWKSQVEITVPESYAGAMCGLCGNYNHDDKDDLTMKNGQLTKVPAEFGASWKTEDIPGCSDQCKGTCPNCDVTQKRQYETNEYCGIITDPTGPFRDCHAKVPPTYFFDDCVFDACLYKGIQSVVCKAISGYVTKCQEAGAQVYAWRTDTFCTPVCPENSHYEMCASGCPSTCASLTTGTQCDALCEEGCQCNEGFILSGVQCVPISQCGCMYSGRYYKAGEMFFPDGLCTSQCTCGASGAVQCQPITCGENEVCKVQNGVQGCHPLGEGKCTASGDPHYTSFDGLKFDFQGTCTYTLAKLLYTNGSLTPFEVQVENESYGNGKVAVTRMVVTKVNGYSITMVQKVQWRVKVNGINTNLPLKLDDGKVSVIQQGKNIILQTEFGLKVLYDSVYYVQVTVPGNYRNKVGGLCGNFNGNKKDEFALQGGGLTENVNAFGASWNIFVEGAKCNHGCDQDCPRCDETKKAKYSTADSCGIISSTTGPFAACHSVISPDIYFENCVFDVCATDGLRDILCRNLEAYTAACQDAGVIIKPWRNDGFCPMTCPKNSQYEVCADTCRSACAGIIAPLTCTSQCYEGCQCDPGFVFDGEQCVSSGNCGCSHNGRYMKVGESLMSADCSRKCTCNPKGAVSCETIQCTTGCAVQNGAQICLDELVDPCTSKQCRNGETCQKVDNQAVCLPLSKAECIAWGDPHYRTFDGRSFDFQGTCTYTIAKTCGDKTLPNFNIEAKNENRGNTRVAYLKHVNVQVYGLTITMAKSENGRVRVNQNVFFLPSSLQDGKVKLYQSGGLLVLETDFGLRLSYDWNHHFTVSVTSTFLNQLCGLCGNYNGDSKDDFIMGDGEEANNAVSFGGSWKVKDDDPACWDDCIGECKTCEPSLISKYQGEEFCGLLAKADGPFRDCHAVIKPELFMDGCVYDVCLNDGFSVFLCQALKTYADVCQAAGVKVYNWRNQSQCPLTCPPNSHYESCGNACPASCSNTSTSVNCKLPCTETCQCNDGFVLSAGECVPVMKCGCTYQDRYYPPGVRLWSDNSCEQSCICDEGTGKVQCRNTKCKSFEVCKVVKGVRGCYSNKKATCSASGDPHYISFDGSKFDFQGTCLYQLAAVCNATDELEKFQVQVQNEHRGNKAVAYTRLVQVNVYGHIIIVSTDHAGKVQVDNLWMNLPLSLENNRLSIQEKGWSAIIQTGFGLQVAFNWHSRVAVTVPESYAGAMCGLCGNYNQDSKDDLTMKNGQLTKVPAEFGASWKTEDIPGCSDQCKGTCPNCDATQKRQYETNEYCGIITDPTGPFRDCHAKVPRTNFFDDCVFDACLYKGMQSVVCKAISGYVTECQQAGAQVYEWRTDKFCTPDCPKNSHYEVCASGCPSTCASLTTGTQCDALCEEGCQCNEGFILSGVQCVPIAQCGCMYSGRYYKAGEMFFPDGLCTSQCTCGASGAVQCQPITCGENEVCKVQNGVQGCHPLGEGKCTASGDPHYTSFDGLKFDFQGTCTYTLAKLLYTNGSLTPFEVQVENESYGNGKVAVTRMVVTKVNGYSITMEQKVQWRVKVNGINTNLPLKLDDGKVSVIQQGKNIILQTEFGLKVLYDSVYYVQVTVPGNYRNKVGGLCGNFNGNKKDEFEMQGGELTENVNAFGASWNIFVEGAKCNHGCDQDCPRCEETKKAKYSTADSCGIISSTTGPFAACHSVISPDIYFENCVFDVCAVDGLRDILCRNLEAYTAACQDAGVIIKPWRNDGLCPMTCPKNSQYEVCADTCGSACASIITPLTCTSQCYEGCQCDPGFVFDGEQCVSSGNCGCVHNGRYMKAGESVMSADCTKKCTCFPKGVVICESISCATGEHCLVLDGVQTCQQEIVDLCEKKQCQTGEQCQVVKNTPVCVPESKAECIAWGDPHYRTFDGQLFSFQGTCTYTIAKTCGEDADLPRFNIEAKNENRGSTQVAYLKYFNVQVYGLDITVAKSENGRVRVDQNVYFLPVTLQDGKVKIYQSGNRGVLQTDFGLRLTFDWNHRLAVSVPSAFLGALCGLCGNYNEDSKDDFRMPDGQQAKNAVSFGGSWKVEDHDPACRDDCNGECKTCEPSFITKYQGEEFCGLLSKTDGPFRDCHAVIKPELFMDGCVYDVCLNDGFRGFLCQALNTYADACQAAGVKVYNWREQSQCPLTCPPNSHYESCGSACPVSCSNPSASVNCKLPCTETCQCNNGFVLSAGECVPVKKCGCTYKGRYYPPGVRLWSDNNCEQSCICDTGTGKVQCRNTKCKSFEVCKVVKGVRGCYSNKKATCSASGDPHYISFDGSKFDFQGTCFYQLAAVCNATDELEKFQVQVQNEHRGNKAVAYTRLVQVNVYGHIIIVSTDHAGKVQVDNLWVNLPLSLENNRLSIQEKGWSAIIQTGFGLQVAFNWHSRVAVTVPESYAGAMCGLCGNYNQDDKDDLTMKDGQLTQVPAEFGASWKTEDIPGCSDQCKGTCPNCDATQKRQYETNAYCGIITDPTGPFKDCHAKVPPTYFFDDCVFDACLYKGMKTVVCKAITAYVTDCQEKGAQVYQWRTKTFCPPDCPQNSHYEVCASGCPSTCASLTTGTQCDALCEEGCQCNEGFILSGVQCVPIAQCGCMYSGRYYKAGEMFFPDGLCTSQCTCGASGAVRCQPITCGENEVCKVQNGVQGCHPLGEGKCTASGDPHYTSFDGLKFDFQGTCTYTLAKLLYTNGSLTPFEVQVENESYGNRKVAVTRMVVTKVNGYSITMEQKVQWKVKLNGISTNLPLKLDDGKISVIQQGKNIILQTEFGLKVLYDSVYYVQVTVPGNYRNKVGGLCGNFNGNKKDEFALQGGGLTENVNAFGASWQVFVEGAKCNHGCDQDCPRCDETNKAKYSTADSCGIISSTTGPFAACHSVISPDIYFENCVFDVCATDGQRDILCRNLEAYTAACQDAGVIIKPWRNDGFCPMTCPVNSQYEVCADTCGSTCASAIAALTCSSKCYEGCQCDSGYVFDGEKCVLLKMCGCVHNGRYMKVGESVVSEDCTERCKCTVEGYVSCEKISCAPGENCVVQRGIRTCGRTHASCNLLSVGGLTTFDKLMTMLGSNGKYKMITLCDGSQTRFEVTADLNLAAPTPITKAVYFNYEATSIVLKPDLMVLVNGRQVVLPADVGDISITVSQGTVVIKHSSGIELKYCSFGNVKVTVSESYASRLCGLCGNFNGLIPDDLMMRSSWIATNILAFHTDWKE